MMSFPVLLVSIFTIVELNCENLFDYQHDSLKNDYEYLPDALRHWDSWKYWKKLNSIGQEIISCGEQEDGWQVPDLVALCEVENDSVLNSLTKRSLLRKARYEYVMTDSPDERGVDVALLYSPFSFALLNHHSLRINPVGDRGPTRDILYASGQIITGDTLHVFVVHAPSRYGGERFSRPYRLAVAERLCAAVDSIRHFSPHAKIVMAGDFNDYSNNASIERIENHGMTDISRDAKGTHGAKGTYRYQGEWGSLDHILVSQSMAAWLVDCRINDQPFLLEDDEKYGGVQPKRNYKGFKYNYGYSDHLPLIARFRFDFRTHSQE